MSRSGGAHAAAERAARESYGKLVAYLAARTGDVDAAEDALSDAFTAALTHWPQSGVPASPEAWLLVTARRRIIDGARHAQRTSGVLARLAPMQAAFAEAQSAIAGGTLGDERLEMLFACAHPALPAEVHAPLMLQTVLGLDAARIASAFLIAPATMSQRLVRAKRKIAATQIPLRAPEPADRDVRLRAVLAAIYAAFAQGWSDPGSDDPVLRDLAAEAVWLGRLVVTAMPHDPEALGMLALMLYAEARRSARRDRRGEYVPLDAQDVRRWDARAIAEAEAFLLRAGAARRIGRFQIEAAIQSAHVVRLHGRIPDSRAIVALYDALLAITASPVVALNRAVAIAQRDGASAGLAALDALAGEPRLREYQPYWAARADVCARSGDVDAARTAYDRAIGLAIDPSVRRYLQQRRDAATAVTSSR